MKSPFLAFCACDEDEEKRLWRFAFGSSLRTLAFRSSSARTLAVREAVALSLMPAAPRLRLLLDGGGSVETLAVLGIVRSEVVSVTAVSNVAVASACFFFFFALPVALFKECVRPCSFSLDMRVDRRSRSVVAVGSIVTMFSAS